MYKSPVSALMSDQTTTLEAEEILLEPFFTRAGRFLR